MLDIKVEAVESDILERTRAIDLGPLLGGRTKGIPNEIGKGLCGLLILDLLRVRSLSSQRQENFLAGRLTDGDILDQLVAVGQQLGVITIDNEGLRATLVAKVGPRPAVQALVGEYVEETQIDDIQRGFLTEMGESFLVGALALVILAML